MNSVTWFLRRNSSCRFEPENQHQAVETGVVVEMEKGLTVGQDLEGRQLVATACEQQESYIPNEHRNPVSCSSKT